MTKLSLMLVLAAGVSLLPIAANASPINVEIAYSINGGGLTTIASGTGSTTVNGTFGNWNIQGSTASTNSPSVSPSGLYFQELTASCTSGSGCGTLQLFASSTGYTADTQLEQGFTFNSTAQTGANSSQSSYWDGSDSFFGTANSFGPALVVTNGSPAGAANQIGPTPTGTYSLTIEQTFAPLTGYTYNTTGSINAAVPEPASLALLGTGLLGLGLVFKRRLQGAEELS